MQAVCNEQKTTNKHVEEGLRILARIIARDFIANNPLNGDLKNDSKDLEYLQNK